MLKTIVLIVLALVVMIGVGVWRLAPSADAPLTSTPINTEVSVTSGISPTPAVTTEGGPVPDALSLPALAVHAFDGRDLRVGQVLASNEAYTRYHITYKSGELTISGIMNVPKGSGPFPILVLNHGFIDPASYTNGRGLKREQDYFARRGYVVLHSDYRNHAESDKDVQAEERLRFGYIEDVINAVYALKNSGLSYLDTNKIGMLGHSMGGGVALGVVVTQPELVDAIVLFAPVSADQRDNFDKWLSRRPEVAQHILDTYGSPQENPTFWDNVSPNTFLDNVQVPIMNHHGTSDESVPLEWSERLQRMLEAKQKNAILHVYPGEPHEFAAAWPQVMQRSVDFFAANLK